MDKIHNYINEIQENNRQTEDKKTSVIACIDSKMIEIRLISQLHVLKSLKETMDKTRNSSKEELIDHSLYLS